MRIYHGSPILIQNDKYFKSGTFFTTDIEIACEYGEYIYMFDMDEQFLDSTEPILGNFVSNCMFGICHSRIFRLIK